MPFPCFALMDYFSISNCIVVPTEKDFPIHVLVHIFLHYKQSDIPFLIIAERQRSDAVRTAPIILDDSGHAFWRLRGYTSEIYILLQG